MTVQPSDYIAALESQADHYEATAARIDRDAAKVPDCEKRAPLYADADRQRMIARALRERAESVRFDIERRREQIERLATDVR
jgi:hypothetical protein